MRDMSTTIPLMTDCATSNIHEAAKELGKNNGDSAGCTAPYHAVERNSKVNMEMVDLGRNPLHKAAEDINIKITQLLLKIQK
jgi:hypothetical protein